MSSTVAIAVAAGANGQAVAANARARRAECVVYMANPPTPTATVQEKRAYADCVYRVHGTGEPMDPAAVMFAKGLIVLAFLGAAIGGRWAWGQDRGDVVGAALMTVVGAIGLPLAFGIIVLCGAALQFLFS